MHELIEGLFLEYLRNPLLEKLEDQAVFEIGLSTEIASLNGNGRAKARMAFTTDSYVVDPLFFPGGDIGKLAINGTVNDLDTACKCGFFIFTGFFAPPPVLHCSNLWHVLP